NLVKNRPMISYANSSTRNTRLQFYESNNEGKKTGIEDAVHAFPLRSRFPDSKFFIVRQSSCNRFEKIHRILRARRDRKTRAKRRRHFGGPPPGHGRHKYFVAGPSQRTNRCLSRIHRNDRRRNIERST